LKPHSFIYEEAALYQRRRKKRLRKKKTTAKRNCMEKETASNAEEVKCLSLAQARKETNSRGGD
jgi:hypothetical protein